MGFSLINYGNFQSMETISVCIAPRFPQPAGDIFFGVDNRWVVNVTRGPGGTIPCRPMRPTKTPGTSAGAWETRPEKNRWVNSRNPTNIKVNDDGYIMMMVNIKVNIFYGYYIYIWLMGYWMGFQLGKWGYPKKSRDGFCEREDHPSFVKWMIYSRGSPSWRNGNRHKLT